MNPFSKENREKRKLKKANEKYKTKLPKNTKQICEKDISAIDNTRRNPEWTKAIL